MSLQSRARSRPFRRANAHAAILATPLRDGIYLKVQKIHIIQLMDKSHCTMHHCIKVQGNSGKARFCPSAVTAGLGSTWRSASESSSVEFKAFRFSSLPLSLSLPPPPSLCMYTGEAIPNSPFEVQGFYSHRDW